MTPNHFSNDGNPQYNPKPTPKTVLMVFLFHCVELLKMSTVKVLQGEFRGLGVLIPILLILWGIFDPPAAERLESIFEFVGRMIVALSNGKTEA